MVQGVSTGGVHKAGAGHVEHYVAGDMQSRCVAVWRLCSLISATDLLRFEEVLDLSAQYDLNK